VVRCHDERTDPGVRRRALEPAGHVARGSGYLDALDARAARDRDLLKPDVSQEEIETVLRRTTPSIGFYALVILLALVLPHVAAIGYLVIAIVVLLQAHGDETLETGTAELSR